MTKDALVDHTNDRLERECSRFLHREAELLDRALFSQWFDLLSPEIQYRVPVRTTRQRRDGEGFSDTAFFFDDDHGALKLRVARLVTDFAWSESPPARTRRMIANIRINHERSSQAALSVTSNLALFIFRGESPVPSILTGERYDVLDTRNEVWRLENRLVHLDTTIVGTDSLAIFL